MNPRKKLLSLLFIILGLSVIVVTIRNLPSKEEIRAREIIQSFMKTNRLDIKPGTDEYKFFMRKIVWGEYPELTEVGSHFLNSPEELNYINAYAWKYSGFKELYGDYHDDKDLPEAKMPSPTHNTK